MKELNLKVLLVTSDDFTDDWGVRLKTKLLKGDPAIIEKADFIVYTDINNKHRILKDKYGICNAI
ncbi:hypothetical protein LCGC14_2497820, partial [marine sediment metagenome]|nr:hypothetical protein [archaeon]